MEWKRTPVDMVDEQRRRLYNPVARQMNDNAQLQLINLPDVCLEAILSNLSYDEISKYRIVRSFNIRKHSPSFCRMQQGNLMMLVLIRFADSSIGSARSCSIVASISWRNITRNVSALSKANCRGESQRDGVTLSLVTAIS